MRWLEEDVEAGYPKVWWELQAMAWNHPEMRERLVRVDEVWRTLLRTALRERAGRVRHRLPARGDGGARGRVQQGHPDRAAVRDQHRPPRAARLDRRLARGEARREGRAQARALRLVADRPRPRPARRGDRSRAARAGRRRRDRLARPGPGDARARARGRAGPPRQPSGWRTSRATSSPSRPSTTSTASRPGAGWTRS